MPIPVLMGAKRNHVAVSVHCELLSLEVSAAGTLEKVERGFQFTRVTIRPVLTSLEIQTASAPFDSSKKPSAPASWPGHCAAT